MIYGSLFSGAGGFDLGLDAAGMMCAFQCEIDKQARAVLRHHWPEVPKHEDVRELSGRTLPRIDLLVGGFPCQDVSVAGNRAGLAGKRTGLFYEFTRLVSELAPEWLLLENVPGLLSSGGGRDMGAVLWALGELGYGWAYRSLDAQYDGVPQRRERLFIVGRAGGRSPVEVLFEPESVPGNPPPRREAREDVAGTLGGGSGSRGWAPDTDRMTFLPDVAGTIGAGSPRGGGGRRPGDCLDSGALIARSWAAIGNGVYREGSGPLAASDDNGTNQFVTHTLRAEGFDASEDGTGRGTPMVPVGFDWYAASQRQSMPISDQCPPIKTTMQPAVFSDPRRHDENHRGGMCERPSLNASNNDLVFLGDSNDTETLSAERDAAEIVRAVRDRFGEESFREWSLGRQDSVLATEILQQAMHGGELRPEAGEGRCELGHSTPSRAESVSTWAVRNLRESIQKRRASQERELARQRSGESREAVPGLSHQKSSAGVRRLTPLEAERLMGWPDGHTLHGVTDDGKPVTMADGPRYRMCGNGVVAPVAKWIAKRLVAV